MNHCKVPCSECPFRKNSLPGYLGGFTAEETIRVAVSESNFDCHLTRIDENGNGIPEDSKKRKACAGRMLFATNTAKSFRRPELEQVRLQLKNKTSQKVKDNILSYLEFIKHHDK